MKKIIEVYGWYGTAAVIGAYALTSFSIIKTSDPIYPVLNLTGAFGILLVSWSKRNYQPAAIQIVWIIVAIIALLKILLSF